ncbi:winged helix DNA-binding domain-containing protein [Cellulomonas persica]|uniref:Winged helix DNA-binding domain-containing protein n=1 Tax=Cellulomonas persica TaxID=76861 RepID=A0A510UW46_9CELL|nr:winged helix DNA-binding domain-containing protein [Cellulomonas persica]GEK18789.1 hypothetical protein CPE01_25220 [Cellulomonas persica]
MLAAEVVRHRLETQHLRGPRASGPVQAVADLLAVQGQELPVARWSLGQRCAGASDDEVRRALDDGALLRTHALRTTWHLLTPDDLRWVLALTSPRVQRQCAARYRELGLDDETLARTDALVARVVERLTPAAHPTRAELAAALAAEGFEVTNDRVSFVVMHAELEGVLVSGRARGTVHTYASADERAPGEVELSGDDALTELVRRFLVGHGPAAVRDVAWWASLTLTQVRRGLAGLGDAVERVEVDEQELWWLPRDLRAPSSGAGPRVDVLQAYDEAFGAFTATRALVDPAGLLARRPTDYASLHVLLIDEQLAGWWQRRVERSVIEVRLHPARELTDAEHHAVLAAFQDYAQFAGQEVHVTVG